MKISFAFLRSIRRAAFVTMMAGIAVMQACSRDAIPTAPLARADPSQPAPDPLILRVAGTVSDDNGPVEGASVSVYRWNETMQLVSTVVTDNHGFYGISFLKSDSISAFTSKEGYASAWHSHQTVGAAVFRWDLRIAPAQKTVGN